MAPTENKKLSFAERQLLKFGWQEGKGLGKNEDGIKAPVRVDVKKDNEGVGASVDKFGFQWWDHLFNKAASNICVESAQNGDQSELKLTQIESVQHRHELVDVHRPSGKTAENYGQSGFVKSA